jgi:hypothetical protein
LDFTPKGWSIEIVGLPRIIDVALRLIVQLMQSELVNYRVTGNKNGGSRIMFFLVREALSVKA